MNFNLLEQSIGHKFSNYEVLSEALTHRSYSNEDERNKKNYERLELLGDAVLELAITDILMNKYPDSSEGELSKARSALVKAGILAKVARSIELGNYIRLGKGEDLSGGRDRDSILSCAMEALLGAVYIDAGFERSQMVVAKLWGHIVDMVFSEEYDVDYKTKLQELMQSRYRVLPAYSVVNISGPSHNRVFKVMVSAGDINQTGLGKNKKEAAQKAASMALKAMQEETRI
jgi:ribonuclease III